MPGMAYEPAVWVELAAAIVAAAAALTGLVAGIVNAWVLLVEIKR